MVAELGANRVTVGAEAVGVGVGVGVGVVVPVGDGVEVGDGVGVGDGVDDGLPVSIPLGKGEGATEPARAMDHTHVDFNFNRLRNVSPLRVATVPSGAFASISRIP